MSGCEQLPNILGRTVAEYLRERERTASGASTRGDAAVQLAQLLRGAALSGSDGASTVARTREALLEHERDVLLVHALSERALEATKAPADARAGKLGGLVQEVREAEGELGETLGPLLAGSVAFVAAGAAETLASAAGLAVERAAQRVQGTRKPMLRAVVPEPVPGESGDVLKRVSAAGAEAERFGDWQIADALRGADRLVIVAHALHPKYGCAATAGARVAARAACRAGVPVVVAVPKYAILKGKLDGAERRGRAHPGAIMDYADVGKGGGIEIVAREFDWVPLADVALVVTEFGGYAPKFLLRQT